MSRLKAAVKTLYGKYLLATNMVTTGTLLATGDILEQQVLQRVIRKDKDQPMPPHDWKRTGRMWVLGFCASPVPHYWYRFLDKVMPSAAAGSVVRKVLADQILGSPVIYCLFFCGGALLEGESVGNALQELKKKFLVTYVADWAFWVPVQTLNFRLVPSHFRMLYVMTAAQIWTVFLSWMKHEYGAHPDQNEAEGSEGEQDLTVKDEKLEKKGA